MLRGIDGRGHFKTVLISFRRGTLYKNIGASQFLDHRASLIYKYCMHVCIPVCKNQCSQGTHANFINTDVPKKFINIVFKNFPNQKQ